MRQEGQLTGLPGAIARHPGEKAPSGSRWLHEIKFDGYRLQARIEAGRVKLLTRSGLDWTAKFGRGLATGSMTVSNSYRPQPLPPWQ